MILENDETSKSNGYTCIALGECRFQRGRHLEVKFVYLLKLKIK